MTELHHEILVQAPPEKVWSVLADLEAVQRYNSTITDAKYISTNREGVGAARQCSLKPKGFVKERVIGWEPLKAITLELYEHQWPIRFMRWRTAIQAESGGTRITQRMEYEMKFGLLGTLMNVLMMKGKMNQTVSEIFVSLKKYIESQREVSST